MVIKDETSFKKQLKALEESHLQPEVRTSIEELDKLLADDFFEFGSSGKVIYKKDCLVEGGVGVKVFSLHDFEIHPLAKDIVLTTYRVKDETRKQETLRSTIWKQIGGRWQMVFHQGTIIQE